jgi:hypothetical protein
MTDRFQRRGMEEQPGLSDQYRTASPWPLLVAVGFALTEVGVFLGLFPIAVGGVLLLGGSVAGILGESGYTRRPWRTLALLGAGFALLGGALVATQVPGSSVSLLETVADPNGVVGRGLAVAVAGVMLVATGIVSQAVGRTGQGI